VDEHFTGWSESRARSPISFINPPSLMLDLLERAFIASRNRNIVIKANGSVTATAVDQ